MSRPESLSSRSPRWWRPRVAIAVLVVAVIGVGLALWIRALSAPVHAAGVPTGSVTPPPPAPTSASPGPSSAGTSSPGASASASPSEPSEEPDQPGTMKASGKFTTASLEQAASSSSGTLYRYAVATETSSKLKPDTVAAEVADVLNDPRSWAGSGEVRFELVGDQDDADFTVYLAAPATATERCELSGSTCGGGDEVVIDALAWREGTGAFGADADGFRRYLVNHGVGQFLGEKPGKCRKDAPAPPTIDQTGELEGCTPNPWPFP